MQQDDNLADLKSNDRRKTKISEHIAKRFHVPKDRADRLALSAATAMEAHGISLDDWGTVMKTIEVVVKGWIRDGIAKT